MLTDLARSGAPLDTARAAVILVHGRGATAESILELAEEITPAGPGAARPPEVAFLAPQAPGNSWYPYSLLAPLAQNEPHLSNALNTLADVFAQLEQAGLPPEKVMLVGFSQGASLSLEFVAGHARRYGGVAGLSGALIGPPGTPQDYPGQLAGTPIFLGCSDIDPYIPEARVQETAQVLEKMGAEVALEFYPGMGHTVNQDEIAVVRRMVAALR